MANPGEEFAGSVPVAGGFEASLDDSLNRSGGRVMRGRSRRGGFRYTDGPFRGLTMDQAVARHRRDYARRPDREKRAWEARGGMQDVRSSREMASAGGGYAGPTPGPITSRGFDALSPAAKAQQIGIFGSEDLARGAWIKAGAPDAKNIPETTTASSTTTSHMDGTKFDLNTPAEAVASLGGAAASAPPSAAPEQEAPAPRAGMINGMPASEAVAKAKEAASPGHSDVVGDIDARGNFIAPSSSAELVGMDNGKPLYQQRSFSPGEFSKMHRNARGAASEYAGPAATFSNPTQAGAASGVETPGDALRKRRLPQAA